ncbi:MAG: DEAD/DEAH box helicase [Terrisporobacter othiniensis]|uniref:DEAD/DEAH box helicase n=1 Tax=Terrisporobacter hibernicus TaxID=2813371 RepID=A0AAX2ZD96_9FIRM|nr:DEAD/DEAH box helicase [Terrisporobacter hibernicus]MDU4862877.1 DEAD/DEAH box helicase [Terrisporobacter othiniensis]MDU6996772.1 DEAD/DEAH box helicase [Terrisporobacter othiniensis]UEL47259.1 DEAD/DEAH box helicase [Terrisporobacter hibernicus]
MKTFNQLVINEKLIKGLVKQNITEPTKVQSLTIEKIRENKDLLVNSETGSGKTLAYLLPMFEKIDTTMRETQVLVLAPTHELVMQIANQSKLLAENSNMDVTTFAIIGEVNIQKQIKNIKAMKPHIVVGTAGRLLDLIQQKKLRVHDVKTIILDEVDSLVSGKGEGIVEKIIKTTLRDRQLLGFTASLDEKSESFCDYMMKDMEIIKATDQSAINPNINHMYIYGDRREKFAILRKALSSAKAKRAIVFVNDEDSIEVINEKLNYHNYKAVCISGKMSKEDRKNAMTSFRSGKAAILVSSDLSARGLDIPDVSHIFNLDFPPSKNEYLHRCGRSARGNKKGIAISIVTNQNLNTIRDYKRQFKINMNAVEIKEGNFVDVDFTKLKKETKAKRENKDRK